MYSGWLYLSVSFLPGTICWVVPMMRLERNDKEYLPTVFLLQIKNNWLCCNLAQYSFWNNKAKSKPISCQNEQAAPCADAACWDIGMTPKLTDL